MGKYTSNDNRSMQCNPNNERYWSSRGYNDYDDEDSYSNNDHDKWAKERDFKYKEAIDETAFSYLDKKILFKDATRAVFGFDPIGGTVEYLSENILEEKLIFKKDFNIKRSDLRSFLLNNTPSKNIEIKQNWFIRDIVEKEGGYFRRYEYLLLEMFVSLNYVIFLFNDYRQGLKSIPSYGPQRWMFKDFKSGELDFKTDNVVEDLSECY
jgi:hypothetical protein